MTYAYWTALPKLALDGSMEPGKGTVTAPNVDDPTPGFYRLKRHGQWIPVAVWPKRNGLEGPDGLGFKIGGEVVGAQVGTARWQDYCDNPITESVYRAVAESGEGWPDADPTVAAMLANGTTGVAVAPSQPIADPTFTHAQSQPAPDPTSEFREQIKTALAGVGAYAKIESDETDVRALSLRNLLNELASAADKAREAEKAPFLKAEREVDAKWQPMVKAAREGARKIKDARDAWQDDKRAAAAEANRRAQEALEQQMREAAEKGDAAAPIAVPPAQSNLPPPSAQVRPAYGKASHTGTKIVVTELDAMKFIAALKPRAEWPAVFEYLLELAQKMANKGIILDGVTTTEKANTR